MPACLLQLEDRKLSTAVTEAPELLATVLGQDLEQTDGPDGQPGIFRIARKVAKDWVISTVDPQARHGHKTVHRGFDGYKGHLAADPDSEIVTDTAVTEGNVGDAAAAKELIKDLTHPAAGPIAQGGQEPAQKPVRTVYGDSAYGSSGQFLNDKGRFAGVAALGVDEHVRHYVKAPSRSRTAATGRRSSPAWSIFPVTARRAPPTHRPRLPQPRQLSATHAVGRRRTHPPHLKI